MFVLPFMDRKSGYHNRIKMKKDLFKADYAPYKIKVLFVSF